MQEAIIQPVSTNSSDPERKRPYVKPVVEDLGKIADRFETSTTDLGVEWF